MKEHGDFFNEDLSLKERNLYDRQFRLKGWDQSILKNSRVLIAGIGGLGCEISKNLAMLGVGHLDLVDLDTVEHSNLNRQILFIDAKEGESKALVAAKKLRKINPNIIIDGHYSSLERLDPSIYANADVMIGGLDSMNARINLNAQAIRFNKPLVDGGVSGYHGHIYTTFPGENACIECYPVISENDDMAACTVVGKPRKRVHCIFKAKMLFEENNERELDSKKIADVNYIQSEADKLAEEFNFLPKFSQKEIINIIDNHDPGIITINATISAIQSHETIKILNWLKKNDSLGLPSKKYVVFNAMTLKFYNLDKKRNTRCTQCGDGVRRTEIRVSKNDTGQKIIDSLVKIGYEKDPEMESILTTVDFNAINDIDLGSKISKNKLRDLELITAIGFKGREIYVTLRII